MKLVSALLLAVSIAAPAFAADFAELQGLEASAISKVNPFPDPSNPDSCYLADFKDGLCRFKCRNGESFQIKPVKPEADSLYQKCGAGDYRSSRGDVNWKDLRLQAADGTEIVINYAPKDLGGTMIADPLWITVVNKAYRGGEKVRVVLMTYYEATASSADSLKETKELDLPFNGTAYQAKGPEMRIFEGHHAWVHQFRQEIAVSVNGKWLVDPVNGSHNFRFKLAR